MTLKPAWKNAVAPLLLTGIVLAAAAPLRAQVISLYFREAARDGKIFVFNTPAGYKAFRDNALTPPPSLALTGYGPHAETVLFENQNAPDLYNSKHAKTPAVQPDRI